jgi:hypothetical protein
MELDAVSEVRRRLNGPHLPDNDHLPGRGAMSILVPDSVT